ncbi:MAG: ABC transporter substrate-binding protein [Candidatus Promineifilaceae bacterium]
MVSAQQSDSPNSALPEGTVTFLFTDIEGSTSLLRHLGDKYISLLEDHHRILREVFAKWNGRVVGTEGDAFFISFSKATEALAAVVEAQRTLAEHGWPEGVTVRVRMGLHTGEPWTGSGGYVGMDVHRAARIAHVGYGGQVLLSETTAPLVMDELPKGVALLDLGRHRLKDIARPEHIRQLVIKALPSEFPPLKSLEIVGPVVSGGEVVRMPAFLEDETDDERIPVFVGREDELEQLEVALDKALDGHGNIFFVAGDAGSGKTALLDGFSRGAQDQFSDLLVSRGTCSAFTGTGDPYAPFRTVLRQLTGDVETAWKGGIVSKEGACRLWSAIPEVVGALVECGPNLLDTFIPGRDLLMRVTTAVPSDGSLIGQVKEMIEKENEDPGSLQQQRLFEEVRDVLVDVASKRPILLLLDDLQWADSGSINLLFHLGRELTGSRAMVVCAYRPEEVAMGRDGSQHPFEPLLHEFKRVYGQVWVDLNRIQGERFVDEFVDSEPNHLGVSFRKKLYEHTVGHALFTVELLRDLQERGDLVKNANGYWCEGADLDWDSLPTRVEGVIEARIGRLEEELRDILSVAAVEGEDFTAQVIAKIQQIQERKLLRTLSRELEKRHQLVKERKEDRIGDISLTQYSFAHALFQRYLYNNLSEGERRLLHGEIGNILEELYSDRANEIAVQLALHFDRSGNDGKAISYLLIAGDQARQIYANQEAYAHYRIALSLAQANNQHNLAARILMKMGLTLSLAFEFVRASEIYKQAFVAWHRASTLVTYESLPISPEPLRILCSNPPDLDPNKSIESERQIILWQLFSGLVFITPEGDVLPDVAKHWEVTDNGLCYVFHLRNDVIWSDGHPVTAYDFEFAWRRALDPDSPRAVSVFFYDIHGAQAYKSRKTSQWTDVGIRAEDESTLRIELNIPAGNFLQLISTTVFYPVPRHVVEEKGEKWASSGSLVSNGPFLLKSYERLKQITLVRNPNYHGKFKGNVGRIEMPVIRKLEQENYYESCLIDIVNLNFLPQDTANSVVRRHAEDYVTGPGLGTAYLGLNPSKPPLDDTNVRRALAMSIDREDFARSVVGSMRDLADGGFIPPGVWGHTPGISLPFDPVHARRLLAKSGYSIDSDLSQMSALCYQLRANELLFPINNWREHLGLKINPQILDYFDFLVYFERDLPQIYRSGWTADYPDPDSFMRSLVANNRTRWNHPQLWTLIEKARYENDHSKRIRLYQEADNILIQEAIIIPLIYDRQNLLIKPWIRNYPLSGFEKRFKDIVVADN